MSVTQEQESNTPSLVPPKTGKKSRAEYARKRRAQCGEVKRALAEIKAIIVALEGGAP